MGAGGDPGGPGQNGVGGAADMGDAVGIGDASPPSGLGGLLRGRLSLRISGSASAIF
eukprot:CAMPEP_0174295818 /NCGR_PEP_ID=MMETSP0809-20121228/45935_1 /TAXON_ID=73025 ORGANISM="Eutreptiella gymnastica-like, Strain CCMP1594" /NCGR_SAMPLE_ID=MMETSP0809 /ASSEMBLY_ACC=CAM_ASM_000658 /LENGTH=56 /DNA_ID=CAMNT_0015398369 /DNA_START=139 /DNA_END=309 /DNA_ORIENTATION=+